MHIGETRCIVLVVCDRYTVHGSGLAPMALGPGRADHLRAKGRARGCVALALFGRAKGQSRWPVARRVGPQGRPVVDPARPSVDTSLSASCEFVASGQKYLAVASSSVPQ